MEWTIHISEKAKKEIKKLPKPVQIHIAEFLYERVAVYENPEDIAESLVGKFTGYHRFRVGDYRLITSIDKNILTILVVHIGHRKEVYRTLH